MGIRDIGNSLTNLFHGQKVRLYGYDEGGKFVQILKDLSPS